MAIEILDKCIFPVSHVLVKYIMHTSIYANETATYCVHSKFIMSNGSREKSKQSDIQLIRDIKSRMLFEFDSFT